MIIKNKIPETIQKIKDYKHTPVDYEKYKTISHSQYSMYNQCEYKWKLQYIDKLAGPAISIFLIFGTAIHATIQHYTQQCFDTSILKSNKIDLYEYLKTTLIEEYNKSYAANNNVHFSTPEELNEFYEQGCEIIDAYKGNKNNQFSNKTHELLGIELQLSSLINKSYPNILFNGFLDIVFYDNENDIVRIVDLKSASISWSKREKTNEIKIAQLLFYKEFFSKQFNIDVDKIEVEFVILKRKLFKESTYAQDRIQYFAPAAGKIKMKKTNVDLNNFISAVFNNDGTYKDRKYNKIADPKICKYCPFGQNEICDKKSNKDE